MLKQESVIVDSAIGSSVMNSTRSRLTLANNRMSLNSKVQYGFTERPSTRDKSPPRNNTIDIEIRGRLIRTFRYGILPKIHCLPWEASWNGLHLVKTIRASRSCNVNSGRPSPIGSIRPPPTVISRYASCSKKRICNLL